MSRALLLLDRCRLTSSHSLDLNICIRLAKLLVTLPIRLVYFLPFMICPLIKEEAIDVVSLMDISQTRATTGGERKLTKSYRHLRMQSRCHHPTGRSQPCAVDGKALTTLDLRRRYPQEFHLVRVVVMLVPPPSCPRLLAGLRTCVEKPLEIQFGRLGGYTQLFFLALRKVIVNRPWKLRR